MKKILLLINFFTVIGFSQEISKEENRSKENPIIYADIHLGAGAEIGGAGTFFIGGGLHYQIEKQLFTIRHIENSVVKTAWFFFIPIIVQQTKNNETALLYGRRFIKENTSFSFSGGISHNKYTNYNLQFQGNSLLLEVPAAITPVSTESYFGFPFEAEVRWFNSNKERFRVFYGIIPVGKKTGFARSFGFKLIGNISKRSYIGVGLSFGLGFHKEY